MKILIAEDDFNIRRGLSDLLTREGYQTLGAANGQEAVDCFRDQQPDFVILDIMMPVMDGYQACREIRRIDTQIPILFLSAKSEEIDRVVGLELGADDFVPKPFGAREIIARIRAISRRIETARKPDHVVESFSFGDLKVEPKALRVYRGDRMIELSQREMRIVELLHKKQGEVVTRDELFNDCWGYDHIPNSRTLDQHISKLRKHIEPDPENPRLIMTVRGLGYRYDG